MIKDENKNRLRLLLVVLFLVLGVMALLLYIQYQDRTDEADQVTIADLDMSGVTTAKEKKLRFFSFLRPVVISENKRIAALRERIKTAAEKNDTAFIRSMLAAYKLKENDPVERLLRRVDMVPVEMVLVQAANESMWGQSRFAREGNNLFGQYCYKKGCGIIPKKRPRGTTHEVAVFPSINAGVRSYLKNINTQPAYSLLRDIRKKIRDKNGKPSGMALADGLLRYSERGQAYVDEIKAMIRVNMDLMASDETEMKAAR